MDDDIPIDPAIGVPIAVAIVIVLPILFAGFLAWRAHRHPIGDRGPRLPRRRELIVYGSIILILLLGSAILSVTK